MILERNIRKSFYLGRIASRATLIVGISVLLLLLESSIAHACLASGRYTRLYQPRHVDGVTTDVAQVRIVKILSERYARASVLKRLRGFDGVSDAIVFSSAKFCDTALRATDVGQDYFLSGRLERRSQGLPVFHGFWLRSEVSSQVEVSFSPLPTGKDAPPP